MHQKRSVRRGLALATLALGLSLTGCDDSNSSGPPDMVQESDLDFVTVRSSAPPLETTDTSFWAVRGEGRELEIRFAGQGGPGTGSRFMELQVDDEALLRRPDGTSFALGDSIQIFVTIEDAQRFRVRLEPSGLQFNPLEPAELEFKYDEADLDFLTREREFDIWRQELAGQPWERIGSLQIEDLDEIEAELLSFTRYALAIGR